MRNNWFLVLAFICLCNVMLSGQLHVGLHFNPAISVGGPILNRIDLEGKVFLSEQLSNTDLQAALLYDFKRGRSFQISGGAGVTVEIDDNIFYIKPIIPIEFEFIPIRSFRQLALPIEIYLELDPRRKGINLVLLLGVRYYFKEPQY